MLQIRRIMIKFDMLVKLMKHVEDTTHSPVVIKATNGTSHSIATNAMIRVLSSLEQQ